MPELAELPIAIEADAGPQTGVTATQGFDFIAALAHHNLPYPAIEWIHARPVLIFNLPAYALLSGSDLPPASGPIDAATQRWAQEYAEAWNLRQTTSRIDADELAGLMTAAREQASLGVFPRALSWVNQQTFFGTLALLLLSVLLLVFARRRPDQLVPANRIQHSVEAVVLFVRNDICRPNIRHHADAWSGHFTAVFLAVLSFNVMGLIPGAGTASANLGVTAGLGLTTLLTMLISGMREQGLGGFWRNLVPVPFSWNPLDLGIWCLLLVVEVMGLLIKPAALAVRLCANMFGGHTVLLAFVTLGYLLQAKGVDGVINLPMGLLGVLLSIAVLALELLLSCLQAYVFTLLSAVFIGAILHADH